MSVTVTSEIATGDKAIVAETPPIRREPLKLTGVLDQFKSFEVTPVIGREYPEASLKEWLESPKSNELLRDLAITSTYAPLQSHRHSQGADKTKSPAAA